MLCNANQEDWSCKRPAKASGLCATHYQQQRRGRPFTPIREEAANTRKVSVVIDTLNVRTMRQEAKRRGVSESAVYREAVAAWARALKKGRRR